MNGFLIESSASAGSSAAKRLAPAALASLPAQVERPRYVRKTLVPGIVHLGLGAFARAHLAAVNEAAIERGSVLRLSIIGVSMRSTETRDALAPQSGLYTLALRDAAAGVPRERLSVIGNLREVLVAPDDPQAVLARIAAGTTRIVSLTVTEKGYRRDPASGALLTDHPDIAHDLLHADAPRSAVGMLVRGLQARRAKRFAPVTVMSLDNLPSNGNVLRALVTDFAGCIDDGLAGWIDRECSFPNSMVDRIVPRTTGADTAAISAAIGLADAWPVVAEPTLEWAIEDRFVAGRPDWQLGGARFVESAAPFERMKLRIVNACHSALAYLAASAGVATVDAAMSMPAMRDYLHRLIGEEILPALGPVPGVDLAAFTDRMLLRFENPALAHQTQQIAMDGSQKLPQRLLGSVRASLARGGSIGRLALAVAAWLRYLEGVDDLGRDYAVRDPLADALAALRTRAVAAAAGMSDAAAAERQRVAAMLGYAPVFGDLGDAVALVDAVATHSLSLRRRGVLRTLARVAAASEQTP